MSSEQKPNDTQQIKGGDESKEKKEKLVDLFEIRNLVELIRATENVYDLQPHVQNHLRRIIESSGLSEVQILFLYDLENAIGDNTADQIYNALTKNTLKKPVLLVLHSPGGSIEPAYLISKCCKEYSGKFTVSVPRKAKSAATLIALGADEIHMGMMSELGPIDPQFGSLPALGLSSAVEHLARLCKEYPESSEMLAKYLSMKLDLRTLGYFERVSESATQYAERLLQGKTLPKKSTPASVARTFVYTYKDHSFVIDKDEAKRILGEQIKIGTAEYKLGNEIHKFLETFNMVLGIVKKWAISIVGDIEDGVRLSKQEQER